MRKMRLLHLICSMVIFRSILAASLVHAKYHQTSGQGTGQTVQWIAAEKSLGESFVLLASTTILTRRKRNGDVEKEINPLPTRHAKHRRRRRCKNRPMCSRSIAASRQFPSQSNNTRLLEEHSNQENHEASVEKNVFPYLRDTKEEQKVTDAQTISLNEEVRDSTVSTNFSKFDVMDSYDERVVSEEIDFEDVKGPILMNGQSEKDEIIESSDYTDDIRSSAIYTAVDDHVTLHEGLSGLLTKLFQNLRNVSSANGRDIFKELNFLDAMNEDPCQKWLNSRHKVEEVFLGGLSSLPACPCQYPSNIFYDDKIWDERQKKHFRWRDVSGESQRLDVYKPGAAYCVRSLLTQGSGSAAAQHCCYDRRRKLLTRGSGAGTPNFVSPEISPILHERIDVLPWRLCKGDFSRYNGVRPPNNKNGCEANPEDEEYQRQIHDTKYY